MKPYKKSLLGSIIALFVATSCCWMSAAAIWFGGVAFIGVIINIIESLQVQLIIISILLALFSMYLYHRSRKMSK